MLGAYLARNDLPKQNTRKSFWVIPKINKAWFKKYNLQFRLPLLTIELLLFSNYFLDKGYNNPMSKFYTLTERLTMTNTNAMVYHKHKSYSTCYPTYYLSNTLLKLRNYIFYVGCIFAQEWFAQTKRIGIMFNWDTVKKCTWLACEAITYINEFLPLPLLQNWVIN